MINVTEQSFEAEVIQSAIPVVVDFWAPWCGPCKMIGPILEQLSAEFDGKVSIVKLNIDDHSPIAESFGITSIPTLKFFKNGAVVDSHTGLLPKDSIKAKILSVLE